MILTIAALLLQIQAIPQRPASTAPPATAEITRAALPNAGNKTGDSASGPAEPDGAKEAPSSLESRAAGDPAPVTNGATGTASVQPAPPSSAVHLSKSTPADYREKSRRREWIALGIAQHSAAAFDAWSTRRALSTGDAQESNPVLRPFANNSSLYAAIQVGPVLFDYASRRMMTSQHGWARHTWWILQAASTVASLASGAHNLTIH
jgi:hypothetical protein